VPISSIRLSDWFHRRHGPPARGPWSRKHPEGPIHPFRWELVSAWQRHLVPAASFAVRYSLICRSRIYPAWPGSSPITTPFLLFQAHQKQGSFPPPALPGPPLLTADYLPGMLCSLPRWPNPRRWLSICRAPASGSSGLARPSPLQCPFRAHAEVRALEFLHFRMWRTLLKRRFSVQRRTSVRGIRTFERSPSRSAYLKEHR